MTNFSIGEAWSQGMAFVSTHFRMILIYVLAGIIIPLVLQFAVLGGTMSSLFNPQAMMANPDNPFAAMAGLGAGFIAIAIVGNIIQSASYFAAWRHGMSGGTEEPAGAITYALTAALLWFVATIVLVIVLAIVIGLPLGLLMGGAAAFSGSDGGAAAGAGLGLFALFLVPALLLLFLWLAARLSVVGPAMADARSVNPLYGLSASWRLTGPAQWSIVGYLALLIIAYIVISLVVGMIIGVGMVGAMAAGSEPGAGVMLTAVIAGLLIGIPVALASIGVFAGIYRALVPATPTDVFA